MWKGKEDFGAQQFISHHRSRAYDTSTPPIRGRVNIPVDMVLAHRDMNVRHFFMALTLLIVESI